MHPKKTVAREQQQEQATKRLSEAGAGGLGTSSDWNASSGKVFSAGYSHPKAAALQQIVKPDPVSQPSSSGQQGGDACPPPCGRPLKKKWMQDHEQRLMQDQEQRLMQEQEQRLMHEQEQRLMHEQAQRLQEENNCSIKVEAKVEAKSQTRDSADGKAVDQLPSSPRPKAKLESERETREEPAADTSLRRVSSTVTAMAAAEPAAVKKLPPRPRLDDFEDSLFTPLLPAVAAPAAFNAPAGPSGQPVGTPRAASAPAAKDAQDETPKAAAKARELKECDRPGSGKRPLPEGGKHPRSAFLPGGSKPSSKRELLQTHSSFTNSTDNSPRTVATTAAAAVSGAPGKKHRTPPFREGQASNMEAGGSAAGRIADGGQPTRPSPSKAAADLAARDEHSAEKSRGAVTDKAAPASKEKPSKVPSGAQDEGGRKAAVASDADEAKRLSRLKRLALADSGGAGATELSEQGGGSGISGKAAKRPKLEAPAGELVVAAAAASAVTLGITGEMRGTESEAAVAPPMPGRQDGQRAVVECIVEASATSDGRRITRDVDLGELDSFKGLWCHLVAILPPGTMPNRLYAKLVYLDAEGDWLLITPDEAGRDWSSFVCCATKVLVCSSN